MGEYRWIGGERVERSDGYGETKKRMGLKKETEKSQDRGKICKRKRI